MRMSENVNSENPLTSRRTDGGKKGECQKSFTITREITTTTHLPFDLS